MSQATFRFYSELNFFLPQARRDVEFTHTFDGIVSIKDMIESLGVPHTEIEQMQVNGASVDFSYLVQDGNQIHVYPMVCFTPLEEPRFVLDVHLGRLAAYLRVLGFDSLFPDNYDDENLARISADEGRILLTRDTGLLKRKVVTQGYYVRSTNPRTQVIEVSRRYALFPRITPFVRCARCNGLLESVAKDEIRDQLEPGTLDYYDDFRRCTACEQIYWQGAHYERMQQMIADIRALGGG